MKKKTTGNSLQKNIYYHIIEQNHIYNNIIYTKLLNTYLHLFLYAKNVHHFRVLQETNTLLVLKFAQY